MAETISLLNGVVHLLVGVGVFIILIRLAKVIEKLEQFFEKK